MTNEDILNELLHKLHVEGLFEKVTEEVNKLRITDITSTTLEIFEKAEQNVRRNETI